MFNDRFPAYNAFGNPFGPGLGGAPVHGQVTIPDPAAAPEEKYLVFAYGQFLRTLSLRAVSGQSSILEADYSRESAGALHMDEWDQAQALADLLESRLGDRFTVVAVQP